MYRHHSLQEWMYQLGNPTQRRNVPYVQGNDRKCICLLCGTGEMIGSSIPSHFQGSLHAKNYRKVQAMTEEATIAAGTEERRKACDKFASAALGQLGLPRWRDELKAGLYDYIQGGTVDMNPLWARLIFMEKSSLLELALWKTSICDRVIFSSVQEMREYVVLDSAFDPDAYAMEKRVTSGCEVVIPLVLSFLDGEKESLKTISII